MDDLESFIAAECERDRKFARLYAKEIRRGRLRRWFIARQLGLRCLVCNRRAGYGGVCPNSEHNG